MRKRILILSASILLLGGALFIPVGGGRIAQAAARSRSNVLDRCGYHVVPLLRLLRESAAAGRAS